MNRKNIGLTAGSVLLGLGLVSISYLWAQPAFRPEPRPNDQGIGRFQVVQIVEREIILLDTVTGELYAAGPKDIKQFSSKPQFGERRPPPPGVSEVSPKQRLPLERPKDKS